MSGGGTFHLTIYNLRYISEQTINKELSKGCIRSIFNFFKYILSFLFFIYRNGHVTEVSKKIKVGKNKELKYKGNNGGEREAGHHRHHREEKTTMVVWPRQEDARGENTEINYGMGTRGEAKKRTS
jgi:hypothetical protein